MGIFTQKEYKTQLYFQDDNKFKFIRRELAYSCLVEKHHGELFRAWKHFFGNQLYFPGYKNMSADTVTLGFAHDVILDPFNKIPIGDTASDKPRAKDSTSLKKWIARIAENQRHIYRSQRKSTIKEDFVNWCLMGILLIMVFAWLISFLKGLYS